MTYSLRPDLADAVKASLADWQSKAKMNKLWTRDATLWTGDDEGKWLDWLTIVDDQLANIGSLTKFAAEIKAENFEHILLLGMGGSSLCVEVMELTFGKQSGYPALHVLDSTDPAQIREVESKIDLAKTLFIVSSKSGSTLEPNIYMQYFFDRLKQLKGDKTGRQFVAVTDPGSKMDKVAQERGFRNIFHGVPGIGGRYSALSNFGMVPSAAAGIDVKKLLDRAEEMVRACADTVPAEENPGLVLGTILGVLANHGRDKVTLIASPAIADLGAWMEQLLAESTGKIGKGLIPVDREPLGAPAVYGSDRVFAYLRFTSSPDAAQEAAIMALESAGQPVVRIEVGDVYDVGKEFFRWEIATAVAGAIIGINAFNQPDVEASKIATRELTTAYEKTGSLPPEVPILTDGDIQLFSDDRNAAALAQAAGSNRTLAGYIKAHLDRVHDGDYFAALAYIQMNASHEKTLTDLRQAVRDRKHVATCVGFGPRFLHSTGQAYKGGPNSGVFLQVTADVAEDLPVPEQKYTFGTVKAAQARGDFQVLADRGRRALRVHLPANIDAGLTKLEEAVRQALR